MPAQVFLQSKGQLDSGAQLAQTKLFFFSLGIISFIGCLIALTVHHHDL